MAEIDAGVTVNGGGGVTMDDDGGVTVDIHGGVTSDVDGGAIVEADVGLGDINDEGMAVVVDGRMVGEANCDMTDADVDTVEGIEDDMKVVFDAGMVEKIDGDLSAETDGCMMEEVDGGKVNEDGEKMEVEDGWVAGAGVVMVGEFSVVWDEGEAELDMLEVVCSFADTTGCWSAGAR